MSFRPGSIVLLTPGFPANEADTSCLPPIQNYIFAYARTHPDIEVHVIAFQYPFRRARYTWNGIVVHALGGRNRSGLRRLPAWLRARTTIKKIAAATEIATLHAFWITECALVGARASKRLGTPLVVSIAGQDARADNRYLRFLDLEAFVITAGSQFAADVFSRHSGRIVDHVIPLGLDAGRLGEVDESAERDIDILGVGALTPLKDYARFIEIVSRLVVEFPGLKACIIGSGPERNRLEQQIGQLRLEDNLWLTGEISREEVIAHMRRSRVFMHTSRFEGQGYVFLEALHAGLPVVCYHVGHTNGSDRIWRCDTPEELAKSAAQLLLKPQGHASTTLVTDSETVRSFDAVYATLAAEI